MDYEQMLQSMLCRNCYEGPGWWDEIVSSIPGEDIGEDGHTPPLLCVESWYMDDEVGDLVERHYYYHLWCRKCLPASLQ